LLKRVNDDLTNDSVEVVFFPSNSYYQMIFWFFRFLRKDLRNILTHCFYSFFTL